MTIQILPLAALLALYAQWRFASPFLPSPTLSHGNALVRHFPLILFATAGVLLALALPNFSYVPFVIALCVSVAMIVIAVALAYRRQADFECLFSTHSCH